MKLFIFLFLVFSLAVKAQQSGVRFEDGLTWEQVKDKAKSENKYIFVDCYTTWCGPCKEMDKSTYPNTKVGEYLNDHFISIRVQMDTSKFDNDNTKQWYSDAQNLKKDYKITGYPSFLFFSSSGIIVSKELGFKKPEDFLSITKDVVLQKKQYYTLLEEYRKGALPYEDMPYLANTSQNFSENKLADSIAINYISNHLDTLSNDELMKGKNLLFLWRYKNLLNSNDNAFKFVYNNIAKIDEQIGAHASYVIINTVIAKENIAPYLYKSGKLISNPNWNQIAKTITMKYDKALSERIILDAKLNFYSYIKDWPKVETYFVEMTCKYGLDTTGENKYWSNNLINDNIFMHGQSKKALEMAIKWMKIIVDADPKDGSDLDTYANLLYKSGRRNSAIKLEEKAAVLAPADPEIKSNLEKMKMGIPTWPTKDKAK